MNLKINVSNLFPTRLQKMILPLVFLVGYLLDQCSKLWAEARFLDSAGQPNFDKIEVVGEYFRFALAYNYGSAFSMKPQSLLPFIPPTVFYVLISIVAVWGLLHFISTLPSKDWVARLGVVLIFSGALGNMSDRFRIGKVVDFIDWDFPDVNLFGYQMYRWPTFNLADSWVLIGIGLIILSPYLLKTVHLEAKKEKK